jgi:predicted SnoaL-like aldol condensation-catalyzing enzyme
MSSSKITLAVSVIVLGLPAMSALAQAPLPTNATLTAQEKANLQLVRDWWREVLVAHHVELIDKYAAPNMRQHNPNAPDGTAALKQLFARQAPIPIPATLPTEPEIQLAQGDIVLLVWGHDAKDPTDPAKMYHYTSFDGFRVANGKLVEHWDAAMKSAAR